MIRVAAALTLCRFYSSSAFSIVKHPCVHDRGSRKEAHRLPHARPSRSTAAAGATPAQDAGSGPSATLPPGALPTGGPYSALALLEHLHVLAPRVHGRGGDGRGSAVDLFARTLGFGLDPNSVENVRKESGVVVFNCGASQLHLNDDTDYCQQMKVEKIGEGTQGEGGENGFPPYEVGLRYDDLSVLKERLAQKCSPCSYEIINPGGKETIRITDAYGRMFVARESTNVDCGSSSEPTISSICQQKVIHSSKHDISAYGAEIVEKYGTDTQPICRGMDYIEFFVPVHQDDDGRTVEKIAQFYEFFFDALTTVTHDGSSHVAIIGFGRVDGDGRAEQSLLFRERPCAAPPAPGLGDAALGTGHHVAVYVGADAAAFDAAVAHCVDGGLLWVNARFEDRVLDAAAAKASKQFRFKDIVDIGTGEVLYVLEHEIRSVGHELFPGKI